MTTDNLFETLEQYAEEEKQDDMYHHVSPNHSVPATRQQRLDQCGKLRHRVDLRTGMRKGYYQKCELNECPFCLKDRANDEMAKIVVGSAGKQVRQIVVPADQEKGVTKTLDSKSYRRYPQTNGEVVILHTDQEGEGEVIDPNELDWEQLVNSPEKKNISGKLGSFVTMPVKEEGKEEEDKGPSKMIRYEAIIVEDPSNRKEEEQGKDYIRAWELATLATCYFSPDLETLFFCARDRMDKYKEFLAEFGYQITFSVYDYECIYESEINWIPYNDSIRKKYAKQGIFPEGLTSDALEKYQGEFKNLDDALDWISPDISPDEMPF